MKYLVRISAKVDHADRKKLPTSKVVTTVREFEVDLRGAREFQGGSIWIDREVVSKKKILEMDLVLDERAWGKISSPRISVDSTESALERPSQETSTWSLKSGQALARNSGSTSLWPAQDIISRIKWDPDLSPEDFLIRYEDRFVGVKETELGNWKSEQTDEEFIPMHRIV